MHCLHRLLLFSNVVAMMAAFSVPAWSQAIDGGWPAKPIMIVLPYSPGGSDIALRLYTNAIADSTRWTFLIDYKPGGNGIIANVYVLKSLPDGHTLVMSSNTLGLSDIWERKPPYDGWNDFVPVFQLTKTTQLLAVNPSLPVRSLKEYITYVKAHPGEVNWGMIGANGIQRLVGAYLHSLMPGEVIFVPYRGTAPIVASVVAGETQASMQATRNMLGAIKSGKIRPLGISLANGRLRDLPELKSIAEEGLPDFDHFAWVGLHAPAATPKTVVNQLNAEFNRVAKLPEVLARFDTIGEGIGGGTPEEFKKHIEVQRNRWTRVAQQIGIKLSSD